MNVKKMTNAQMAFLVAAIYESFFAIPWIGWFTYANSVERFIVISLAIHIVALILANQEKASVAGNMVGILASAFAIIPVLGWLTHLISAALNYLQVFEISIANSSPESGNSNDEKSKTEKKNEENVKDTEVE